MTRREKNEAIARKLRGVFLPIGEIDTLRRAEMTLRRWAEEECNGTIQRDETSGQAYRHCGYGNGRGPFLTTKIADREAGALRRIEAICKARGLYYFHQTDPRGCALYVSAEPMTDSDYSTKGVAICA